MDSVAFDGAVLVPTLLVASVSLVPLESVAVPVWSVDLNGAVLVPSVDLDPVSVPGSVSVVSVPVEPTKIPLKLPSPKLCVAMADNINCAMQSDKRLCAYLR